MSLPDWIPVTEDLPDENEEVLFSWGDRVGLACYERIYCEERFHFYVDDDGPVEPEAWMPAPKPYRRVEEDPASTDAAPSQSPAVHVDPSFTGESTGTVEAPFKSIAEAMAHVSRGIIILRSDSTLESLTLSEAEIAEARAWRDKNP